MGPIRRPGPVSHVSGPGQELFESHPKCSFDSARPGQNAPPAAPTLAFFFYARARALGLADMGRKVDLVERSIRRGEADPELADTLRRKAQRKSL